MRSQISSSSNDRRASHASLAKRAARTAWHGLVVSIGLTFFIVHCARPATSHARPDDSGENPRQGHHKPWFQGVDMTRRTAARVRFLEGNRLLQIPAFARAAEQYKLAIAIWEHPAFYYNLAIAQLNLVQPIEAYASVQSALRYGPEPLGEDKYQQALDYRQRLEEQLTRVVIVCDQPGAEVTLDGKLVFVGPGRHEHVLLPGSHQILARKDGLIPETEQVVLSAGERIEVHLAPGIPERVTTTRHISGWIPWVSLGAGATLLASAGYLDWYSSNGLAAFDDDFNARCRRGCIENQVPDLSARLDRAEQEKRAALGLYIAGGVMVVGSAILVYVNRERVLRTKVEHSGVTWTPTASPHSVGVSAQLHF